MVMGHQQLSELARLSKVIAPPQDREKAAQKNGVNVAAATAAPRRLSIHIHGAEYTTDVDSHIVDYSTLAPVQLSAVGRLYEACRKELTVRGLTMIHKYRRLTNEQLAHVRTLALAKMEARRKSVSAVGDHGSMDVIPDATLTEADIVYFDVIEQEVVVSPGGDSVGTSSSLLLLCLVLQIDRRRTFSRVDLRDSKMSKALSVSEDGGVLRTNSVFQYGTLVLNKPRSAGGFGRWQFEVEIVSMPKTGASIHIGWDAPTASTDAVGDAAVDAVEEVLGMRENMGLCWQSNGWSVRTLKHARQPLSDARHSLNDGEDGSMHTFTGIFRSSGKATSGFPSFGEGDVIACTIDQNEYPPQLRWYKNGEQVIPKPVLDPDTDTLTYPGFPISACVNRVRLRYLEQYPGLCL